MYKLFNHKCWNYSRLVSGITDKNSIYLWYFKLSKPFKFTNSFITLHKKGHIWIQCRFFVIVSEIYKQFLTESCFYFFFFSQSRQFNFQLASAYLCLINLAPQVFLMPWKTRNFWPFSCALCKHCGLGGHGVLKHTLIDVINTHTGHDLPVGTGGIDSM